MMVKLRIQLEKETEMFTEQGTEITDEQWQTAKERGEAQLLSYFRDVEQIKTQPGDSPAHHANAWSAKFTFRFAERLLAGESIPAESIGAFVARQRGLCAGSGNLADRPGICNVCGRPVEEDPFTRATVEHA